MSDRKFKSENDLFNNKLKEEGRIRYIPPTEVFDFITSFNRERSSFEAEIKQNEIAAEKELAGIDLVG